MKEDLRKIAEHENSNWSRIFQAELGKNSDKKFSSFWWQNYYDELTGFIDKLIFSNSYNTVLEAGSGSGKATLLLNRKLHKTLLDISPVAIEYAKHIANKLEVENVNFVEANIFSMPFENNFFDLVWNIGVIEHYEIDNIKVIINEMVRICARSGTVAVGIPNFYSGPIIKAWLLKKLKFIPGYKLDTEKFYDPSEIENIFRIVAKELERKVVYIKTEHFGNPLIIETPVFILKTIGKPISFLFERNKFLKLIVCKFE